MAFQFTLESLLRLRRSEQRQQELALQKANERATGVLREIEAIDDEARRIATENTSAAGVSGAELQFGASRGAVLDAHRTEAGQRLRTAREQQVFAAQELRRAWQRREAIETLRERERQSFALAEGRAEQRRQDDLFLQRRLKR